MSSVISTAAADPHEVLALSRHRERAKLVSENTCRSDGFLSEVKQWRLGGCALNSGLICWIAGRRCGVGRGTLCERGVRTVNVPWIDDEDGEGVWVRGGDYLTGWRDADDAARAFNGAALRAGYIGDWHASPHAGPSGEGVVWLSPAAVRELARLLEEARHTRKRSA